MRICTEDYPDKDYPAKIGEVVGQRGKVINAIIDECGVKIDITDDGFVSVCGVEQAGMDQAMKISIPLYRILKKARFTKVRL